MGTFAEIEKKKEEMTMILQIVERAENMGLLYFDRLSLMMDLECANEEFNLRLDELLKADDFNFSHDIGGIQYHIDRSTKTFQNHFVPRFTGRSIEAEQSKNYTFSELVDVMQSNGDNLADVAVGSMMDIIEEQTGKYPNWNDTVPEWVIKNCLFEAEKTERNEPEPDITD